MNQYFVAVAILALSTPVFAEPKDNTNPLLTCGIIGQLVQDAAISLGPVYRKPPRPFSPASGAATPAARKRGTASKAHKAPAKADANPSVPDDSQEGQPRILAFKGEQMWGSAAVKVVTGENCFDCKVESTLPVRQWTLLTEDTQIASQNVGNKTVFSLAIPEPYNPPYTLFLSVLYMGIPNQVRVVLK